MSIVKGNCFVNLVISLLLKKRLWNVLALHWRRHGVALLIIILNGVLATATQLGEVLEIYNLKDSTQVVRIGPHNEPEFKVSQGYGIPVGIMGFSDIQVTDQAIYTVSTDVPLGNCHSSPGVKKLMADNIFMYLV